MLKKPLQILRIKHPPSVSLSPCVATIGNFDGIHLGHQRLINQVVSQAKTLNLIPTIIIFEPMPQHLFRPSVPLLKLTTLSQKIKIFAKLGIERVIILRFNTSLSQLSPTDFIEQYLVTSFNVKHIIVGDNFRFGYKQSGDTQLLHQQGERFGFTCETLTLDGAQPISSTLIRQALLAGDCQKAWDLLGRPFQLSARVMKGKGLGTQWGIPTANMPVPLSDPNFKGVFVVKVNVDDAVYPGVANLGTQPTFEGKSYLLEAHLFDFNGDLYGKYLNVELLHKLRDEERFSTTEALRQQILQDIQDAKKMIQHTR